MSDSPGEPWSDNPNAPHISTNQYTADKELFAGYVIGAIAYGIVITLFFQCLEALIGPANNTRRDIKWWLVAHTVALFLFLTIPAAMDLYTISIEYVDNRNFPTGPVGYDNSANLSNAFIAIYTVMFPINQWLADGLLLYRCYVIYSMNHRAIVFPCLLYVASVAMGIVSTYVTSIPTSSHLTFRKISIAYCSICLSLNILITLMITIRLILHIRDVRQHLGALYKTMGWCSTIVTMFVESCALYAAALLFYIIPFVLRSQATPIPAQTVAQFQVIAPYLIILRVAKRRALTGEVVTSGSNNASPIRFAGQGTTDSGDRFIPDVNPISSMRTPNEAPDEVRTRGENGIEEVPLRQDPNIP